MDSARLRGPGREGGGEGIGLKPSQKPRRQKGTQQTAGVQSRVKAFGEKNLQEQRMEDAQHRELMGKANHEAKLQSGYSRDVNTTYASERSKGNLPKRQSLP